VSAKPVPLYYGERKVFTVAGFNQGVSWYLRKLPTVWVEGEIAELKRSESWGFVYLTLKDPEQGATLAATMTRQRFAQLDPPPAPGERVHALGRADVWDRRGELRLTVLRLERFGLGLLLRQIEELRQRLAAEGLFATARKRPLPFLPRAIGVVCGSDAAAKADVVDTVTARYPPARFQVVETVVQGPGAPARIVAALRALDAAPQIDVIVLARGGGSVEDLLPFSDEAVCRAVAACATPVVSAIGHEQDTPLVDLVADVRASTPSVAGRLVVPDLAELRAWLERAHGGLARGARTTADRHAQRAASAHERLRRAPLLAIERKTSRLENAHARLRTLSPKATLERGYAIVRSSDRLVRSAADVSQGDAVAVELHDGTFGARVE
jgi:exodeoxyribonuclease VII large subunit